MKPNGVIHLTDETYDKVVSETLTIIIDFYTDWCGPCRLMAPIVEQIAEEYAGKVTFAKINAQNNPQSSLKLGITGVPTFIGYKNGKPVIKAVGAIRRQGLEKMAKQLLKAD